MCARTPPPRREFYCHSIGHYLGLDVHDTNTIGPHRALEPGVVLAIEPGLYIPPHPQFGRFAGIGVRLEDDVLVGRGAAEVLSSGVPVDPEAVEALVGSTLQEPLVTYAGAAAASGGSGSRGGSALDAAPAALSAAA
jgi:hypothetical protein